MWSHICELILIPTLTSHNQADDRYKKILTAQDQSLALELSKRHSHDMAVLYDWYHDGEVDSLWAWRKMR